MSVTKVSVYLKTMERQRVSTCLQVFCDETLSALKVHPDSENNDGTVKFIAKFIEFGKIMNAADPCADICLRNLNRAVIHTSNDENLLT